MFVYKAELLTVFGPERFMLLLILNTGFVFF